MLYVNDLIVMSAQSFLRQQGKDGEFMAGHNGPYYDEELPNRNTAHVMILLLKAYAITQEDKFLNAATRALSYILQEKFRPMGATFWVRNNPEKDFCNGLIGQAWICEALIYAYGFFKHEKLLDIARSVLLLHPFNTFTGLWRIVNVDGSYNQVDRAFNHQLWFAAVASSLNDEELNGQIKTFLDKITENLGIYRQGLIIHSILKRGRRAKLKYYVKSSLKSRQINSVHHYKEIGYHAFNTYGFAMLFKNTKGHPFWSTKQFARILGFLCSPSYVEALDYYSCDVGKDRQQLPHNRYGYAYNPPGIEVAYTLQTFDWVPSEDREQLIRTWLHRQVVRTFDRKEGLMNRNTEDEATLSARMYEIVKLNNYEID
jgi:hypothetical protein